MNLDDYLLVDAISALKTDKFKGDDRMVDLPPIGIIRRALMRHGYATISEHVDLIKERDANYYFVNYETGKRTQYFATIEDALRAAKPNPIPVAKMEHDDLEWS